MVQLSSLARNFRSLGLADTTAANVPSEHHTPSNKAIGLLNDIASDGRPAIQESISFLLHVVKTKETESTKGVHVKAIKQQGLDQRPHGDLLRKILAIPLADQFYLLRELLLKFLLNVSEPLDDR
jgi:hypothetical protein